MQSRIAEELAASLRDFGHERLVISADVPATSGMDETAIGALRERLRRELDQAVAQFNPHLIHADGLTFWGQLASETGVPYVATLRAHDLSWSRRDGRLQELAEQGAENARRVLVPRALAEESARLIGGLEHTVQTPWWPRDDAAGVPLSEEAIDALRAIYLAVLGEPRA
jgi:hypothetical protein